MKDRDLPGEWEGSSGACRRDGEVLLGVTGCIGAYKAAEVVRLLRRRDMGVQVVMTRHAGWFMTSGTLETLSGRPVLDHLFKPRAQGSMEHIELARRADLFLVAPATANCVGKFAAGIADDLLSTIHLAFKGPVVLAPAMNTGMYRHPAVQRNLEILERRGVRLLGPDQGELACGETGPGRLVPPEFIVQEVVKILGRKSPRSPLAGRSVLVSAGPPVSR
ncbi:MAG: flavoprotein [Acidobacteriota bacterium]